MEAKEVVTRFTHHVPKNDQPQKYAAIRSEGLIAAGFDEFPFREIGALLWPLLIVALAAGIG